LLYGQRARIKVQVSMRILIDNQIFEEQKFGGISRYFNELQVGNDNFKRMEFFKQTPQKKLNFQKRVQRKLARTFLNKEPTTPLNKFDFYNTQIKNINFDIFHPTYYDNYFLEKINKPFVITVYDMIHEKYPEYFEGSHDSINKYELCKAATKIIAISHSTKTDLIDIFNIPADKIVVTHLATYYDTLKEIKPILNFNFEKYILFTGNRSVYKNFLTFLISVAPILKQKKNLKLICTGPQFSKIENKWIEDLGLKGKVESHFCLNDNELVYFYKNAECFVFPSLYEGFGFPVLEAFATNCPLITSPGGSLKEIAGDAAVYFDPKDIKQMRESIESVLADDNLKQEMIESGKKQLKKFSWEKCRKETNAVYSQVVQ
jgi:glycosyltransferase involved in cell wall biosynthesis